MNNKPKSRFLKVGGGKLASEYHGETKFSEKRKSDIIKEQEEREKVANEGGVEFGWRKIENNEFKEIKKPICWDINKF